MGPASVVLICAVLSQCPVAFWLWQHKQFLWEQTILTSGLPFLGLNHQFRAHCLVTGVWVAFFLTLPILKFILPILKAIAISWALPHQKSLAFFANIWETRPEALTRLYRPVNHWSSLALCNLLNVTLGLSVPGCSDEVQDRPPGLDSILGAKAQGGDGSG